MKSICRAIFILLSIFVSSQSLRAAPPARSVSPSHQFIIYGANVTLRGAVSELAERTKANLLALLRQPDGWKTPIVVNLPVAPHTSSASPPVGAQHAAPLQSALQGSGVALASLPADSDSTPQGENRRLDAGATTPLVLPSVPVDQLLDDHAVEFEECKRWSNSEAGQSARMTNPAGFANVRAHAEAHLRALTASAPGSPGR